MKLSKFRCPECSTPLQSAQLPSKSKTVTAPYFQLWCANPRCTSDAAQNDGGSGPTEEEAFRSLCNAVDREMSRLAELSPWEEADKKAWAKADHENDLRKGGL